MHPSIVSDLTALVHAVEEKIEGRGPRLFARVTWPVSARRSAKFIVLLKVVKSCFWAARIEQNTLRWERIFFAMLLCVI